ncbi:MAG: Uma2 family endonuclease [Saprospiraceae bacterium]|nr:Uma2 family endonuclease [Saprospiraceae bacterium]MCB9325266.1 Uma2 family endonuclease [Lewinellaceae bacterium]
MQSYTNHDEKTIEDLLAEPSAEYTIQDYLSWPFDEMVELIRGKVFRMSPGPNTKHQRISTFLLNKIYNYLEHKKCEVFHAPFDVYLPVQHPKTGKPNTVVQPDITVICDPKKISEKGCEGSPDMVMEIISDSTRKKDIQIKFELYEECKINTYWLVFPKEEIIEIFELNATGKYERKGGYSDEDELTSDLLPGLRIKASHVFQ